MGELYVVKRSKTIGPLIQSMDSKQFFRQLF